MVKIDFAKSTHSSSSTSSLKEGGHLVLTQSPRTLSLTYFTPTWFAGFQAHGRSESENYSRHKGLLEKHILNVLRSSD